MHSPQESQLYHRLSCIYDFCFAPFLVPGIHATIRGLNIPRGARVLDVGVGTGLSLSAYPKHAEVVAIDYSDEMLLRADQLVRKERWNHITLKQMDALDLEFPDGTFDYVMAFHILTVVSDCNRLLNEIARVAKVGGTVVIINHFREETRWSAKLLDFIDPLTRRLGWQTTLTYENLMGDTPFHVVRRDRTAKGSPFTVIIAKQTAKSSQTPMHHFNPVTNGTS